MQIKRCYDIYQENRIKYKIGMQHIEFEFRIDEPHYRSQMKLGKNVSNNAFGFDLPQVWYYCCQRGLCQI